MKRSFLYLGLIFALILAILALALWNITTRANTNRVSQPLYIYDNTSQTQLIELLDSGGYIKSRYWFKIASKLYKLEGRIKVGRYIIEPGLDNRSLVRKFSLGLQTPHNLVLSGNIRGAERLASTISHYIYADSATVLERLKDSVFIDSLGFNSYTLPAMFLLNTYEIYWTSTPKQIVERMHKEYRNFWNRERLLKAEDLGLSPIEVVTLASIVAEESNLKLEHPVIAGVYINRLKRGIPLQADPTVKFALNDPSIRRVLYKHLEVNSPYNTYKYKGLPPGPIVIVAPHIVESVLNYTKHKYLYFCANPSLDGSHSFATTLSQHNRNAAAYHAAVTKLYRNR